MSRIDRWRQSSLGPQVQLEFGYNRNNHKESNNMHVQLTSEAFGQEMEVENGPF